jgi:hypothetical protein
MGAAQTETPCAAEPEGLPDIYRELADVVGLEATLVLARYLGGTHQYFPCYDRIELAERNRRIRAEFNGRNQRELAKGFGLTTRQVREILRRTPGGQAKPSVRGRRPQGKGRGRPPGTTGARKARQ